MTVLEPPTIGFPTLADRLADGKMPVVEALRYAMQLAEALREIHDRGEIHGGVSAESIVLAGEGVVLAPAPGKPESYPASISTDIFAFGAVLYQMLTGLRLAGADAPAVLESCGIPAADRLIARCLGKEPPARFLNMQKVLLELKLITMIARRAGPTAAMRRQASEAALRAEMQEIEARMGRHLEEQEKRFSARQTSVNDLLNTLRAEFVTQSQLAAAQHGVDAHTARLNVVERAVDGVGQSNAALAVKLAKDIDELKASIEAHSTRIESLRASTAEMEDVVQRVVEAMETVQESVLDMLNAKS